MSFVNLVVTICVLLVGIICIGKGEAYDRSSARGRATWPSVRKHCLALALILNLAICAPPLVAQSRRASGHPSSLRPAPTPTPRPTPAPAPPNNLNGLKKKLTEKMQQIALQPYFDKTVADSPGPAVEVPAGLTPVEQVDYLLADNGLALDVLDGQPSTRVLVFKDDDATRARVERLTLAAYRLHFASADVLAALVGAFVQKAGRFVQSDKDKNILYVTGSGLDHVRVKQLLAAADVRPQVIKLQVGFVHFTDDQVKELHARFGAGVASSGLFNLGAAAVEPTPALIPLPTFHLNVGNEATRSQKELHQNVLCEDRRPCVLSVGRELPVKSTTGSYYMGGGAGPGEVLTQSIGKLARLVFGFGNSSNSFETVEYKNTSLDVSITPTVLAGNEVRLQAQVKFTDTASVNSRSKTPVLETMQLNSTAIARLGKGIILASFQSLRSAQDQSGAFSLFPIFKPLHGPRQKIRTHGMLTITPSVEGAHESEDLLVRLKGVACLLPSKAAQTKAAFP